MGVLVQPEASCQSAADGRGRSSCDRSQTRNANTTEKPF
jgi:hypothetical protein